MCVLPQVRLLKSHSAFSDNFADYEFKRKVPVSIYRFTWTVESKTKLMHFSFILVKTRFANSVTFAQTGIYNSNISFTGNHYIYIIRF